MNVRIQLAVPIALLLLAAASRAGTIHVPQDQPTIQAGVDAAQSGDTVLIGAGTYSEAVVISGATALTLKAKGKVIVDALGSAPCVLIEDSTEVELDGLRFADGAGNGVQIDTSTLVTLSKCRFDGFLGDGVASSESDHVILAHCTFTGIETTAVALPGDGTTPGGDWLISHCTFKDMPPTSAAMFLKGNDGRVEDSHILGVANGLFFGDNTSLGGSVTGNHFTDSTVQVDAVGATVSGNVLVRTPLQLNGDDDVAQDNVCKQSGLTASFGTQVAITGNKISLTDSGSGIGISVLFASGASVQANVIKGHSEFGINATFCDGAKLDGNHVSGADNAGILIASSNSAEAGDNVLKGCEIGLKLDDQCSQATIGTNHVSGSHDDGLLIDGTQSSITANIVHGSHASGLHLGAQSVDDVVSQNVVHGSHDFDLLDESGGANVIENDNDFGTTSP